MAIKVGSPSISRYNRTWTSYTIYGNYLANSDDYYPQCLTNFTPYCYPTYTAAPQEQPTSTATAATTATSRRFETINSSRKISVSELSTGIIGFALLAATFHSHFGGLVFTIFSPEDDNWFQGKTRVLDVDRNISLQFTNATGREFGRVFVLRHGDAMQIPFHTRERTGFADGHTGKPYFITEIASFGTSIFLRPEQKVTEYSFREHKEVLKWKRIAVEALLIYGLSYDGPKLDPDYTRALLDGQLLTRRDFGYAN